jgi:hypothetical protein
MLCVPYGVPTMMSVAVYPVEFIQTPKQITIISEAFSEVRRIYLDKPPSKIDEVPPGYYGRSVGRWEGDTLVVDTVGIKEAVQYQRMPHSDQMRITEIRLAAPDILRPDHDRGPGGSEKLITHTLCTPFAGLRNGGVLRQYRNSSMPPVVRMRTPKRV